MRKLSRLIAALIIFVCLVIPAGASAAPLPQSTWMPEYIPTARGQLNAMGEFEGVLYAVGNGQLFRSTDRGGTWAARPRQFGVEAHTMAVIDDRTILVGNNAGIFRSTDAGLTWQQTTDESIQTTYSLLRLRDRVLAMSLTYHNWQLELGGSLVVSTDEGQTWSKVGPKPTGVTNICTDVSRTALYGMTKSGWIRSADGGNSWIPATQPANPICASGGYSLPNSLPETTMPESSADGTVTTMVEMPDRALIAFLQGGQVLRKTEGGGWQERSPLPDFNRSATSAAVGPDGALYVAGGALYRTTDQGETWTKISVGQPVFPGGSGVAITREGNLFLRGTHQTNGRWSTSLYRSSDWGKTWADLGPYNCQSLWTDGATVACWDLQGSGPDQLLVSRDQGVTWNKWELPFQGMVVHEMGTLLSGPAGTILFSVAQTGGGNAGLFRTTDNGYSWTQIDSQYHPTASSPDGRLLRFADGWASFSTDGGDHWVDVAGAPSPPSDLYFFDENRIYGSGGSMVGTWRYQVLPLLADVNNHWARPAIETLVKAGIVSGYPDGSFQPELPVSRAQLVKLIGLARQLKPDPAVGTSLTDVQDSWVMTSGYLGAALRAGIVKEPDYDNNRFEPDRPVSRAEMAIFLVRAAGLEADATHYTKSLPFSDRNEVSPAVRGYIGVAVDHGLLNGMQGADGTMVFHPSDSLTRAEAAAVIVRLMEQCW